MSPTHSPACPRSQTILLSFAVMAIAAMFLVPAGTFASVPTASSVRGEPMAPHPIATPFHVKVTMSSADDWPELHQTPALTGYASHSGLSSLTASALGVAWATNAYGSILDSPVLAYDPLLGATLVYVGTETGNVVAVNLSSGQIVWGNWLGSPILSSPLVYDGAVYVGTYNNPALFKLNATTGTIECRAISPHPFEATPTVATPPGGVPTVFIGSLDGGSGSGPFMAINAGNCSIEWKFTGYHQTAGSWDSASYIVNKSGVGVVVFGTDNPDSSVYALNALTGTLLWRFQCYNPAKADFDVAAGVALTPPGKNGFTQGVAYAVNKAGRAYALDLNNGTLIWETNFNALAGVAGVSRSTPALDGTNVIFGYASGLFNLNATSGAQVWNYVDPTGTESVASPAIAGGGGHGIVVTGDVGGDLDVLSVVGGTQLYTYPTGGYITASPAVSGGNIVLASADGYLYDFAVGAGNDLILPTAAITSPLQSSALTNPNGNLTVTGTATDPIAVVRVAVAIQSSGVGGPWWDATTDTWSPGPVDNFATLGSPGAASTAWNLSFPVPEAGGTYAVTAYATSSSGQSDLVPSSVSFAVKFSTTVPHIETSTAFVAPDSSFTVIGGGFGKSEKVALKLFGKTLATVTSRANGSLPSTTLVVPEADDHDFGQTSLVALGKTSGRSTTAAITIANSWAQSGDGPGHAGFEANDPILNLVIFPGHGNWIRLAWHFDAGVPINASPAVIDGVAYVADTVGNVYALDIQNGGILWTFTLASGAAIDGTPAVDPALRLVFVGANDGTVDAISTSNGTLDWSTSVGGNVSAPVLSGGEVYVTSNSGQIEALSESTGAVAWSIVAGSAITSAPSLNASAKLLVVGEANGDVQGLYSTNGTTRWTFVTGGAVTASAAVTGGTVYVGSDDHKVYALNQLTGALRWSFKTGGAVGDTGTLDGKGLFFIGSRDGTFYVLHASNGALDFNFTFSSPVVGISSTDGIEVYETASGIIGAEKTYLHGGGWKFQTGAGLVTAPVILDGTVYVCAGDGSLYAFTSNGQPPV